MVSSLTLENTEKIVSNHVRVDIILHLLAHKQLTLSEITMMMGKSKSAMSRQMKQLVEFDMIEQFEQDLNNPGSPHKAYRISQEFVEAFMYIRDQKQFFDRPAVSTYISYMIGMLAVSNRMNDLTRTYLSKLQENHSQNDLKDQFVDMGILLVPSKNIEAVQQLLQKFVKDVEGLTKSEDDPGEFIVSLGIHPFQKLM